MNSNFKIELHKYRPKVGGCGIEIGQAIKMMPVCEYQVAKDCFDRVASKLKPDEIVAMSGLRRWGSVVIYQSVFVKRGGQDE